MLVDDVAYGGVVLVVGSGKRSSAVVGLLLVLEQGQTVNFLGSVPLGAGVLGWVAPLAEFGFQFVH